MKRSLEKVSEAESKPADVCQLVSLPDRDRAIGLRCGGTSHAFDVRIWCKKQTPWS
jgi:hypothetical protein